MLPRTISITDSIPSDPVVFIRLDNTVEGEESFTLRLNSSDPRVTFSKDSLTVIIDSDEGEHARPFVPVCVCICVCVCVCVWYLCTCAYL